MNIYLAGRCDTNWRSSILDVDLLTLSISEYDLVDDDFPVYPNIIRGIHNYTGAFPIMIDDSHACDHGIRSKTLGHNPVSDQGLALQRNCFRAIDTSDIVFAWIDRAELYGTVAEIVYAATKGKRVWLAFADQSLEQAYWFAAHCATLIVDEWSGVDTDASHAPDNNGVYVEISPLTPREAFDVCMQSLDVLLLRALPYAEYLKTDHWATKRAAALTRYHHHCMLCNAQSSLQVHHNTYERLGEEADNDLIVLCKACHYKFHFPKPVK